MKKALSQNDLDTIERSINNIDSFLFEIESISRSFMDNLSECDPDDFRAVQLMREIVTETYAKTDELYALLEDIRDNH